jgi:Fe-S-cluster containining protein
MDAQEWKALLAIERAFREAKRKGGDLVACRAGCDACCARPFAITKADAERLRRGMGEADPAVAEGIRERARRYREALSIEFPGDLAGGKLTAEPEWRQWFFDRWAGPACPVLDPEARTCLLRKHRPAACRLYGPLIRIGGAATGPCGLCYEGAGGEELDRCAVDVGGDWAAEEPGEETIVALAVLATAEGGG